MDPITASMMGEGMRARRLRGLGCMNPMLGRQGVRGGRGMLGGPGVPPVLGMGMINRIPPMMLPGPGMAGFGMPGLSGLGELGGPNMLPPWAYMPRGFDRFDAWDDILDEDDEDDEEPFIRELRRKKMMRRLMMGGGMMGGYPPGVGSFMYPGYL